MRKRLKVLTVGCKANFADSASVVRLASALGFDVVSAALPADVVVINSCTVTHRADRDSRALARRARRENPGTTVILAGCYAQVSPSDREKVPEADHWVGTPGNRPSGPGQEDLAEILKELSGNGGGEPKNLTDFSADMLLGHRRTFLKIQDGCDFSCAYCVVPRARGKNRSVPEEEIVERAVAAEDDGAREIVLTGIHIGLYGADSGKRDALPGLVRRLLDETSRARIRLSSVEPGELTERLIETIAGQPRVCAHLHVPLQSGCDRTLRRMRRPYVSAEYGKAVSAAAARIPGLSLGADVIVGFPGETPADFEETVRFLENSPVSYLHVFPYSARPGTQSASFQDDVHSLEKKRRGSRLLALDAKMREAFLARQIGATVDVLAEEMDRERNELSGRAGNYAEVRFPGNAEEIGEIHRVVVETVGGRKLSGKRIE
ncbi:MAG TPA: tRNA (N(6)-L-threonylcarbamoyladenosine(37)-C(2))-methylthiotransferase MtaB [Candidatus Deferrimicrobiaceae bacterium]|nr:tRNA (N(6)-L-threonylcarbamoyladenosine(37)-C(2))-methylthiotransferase MtaB [Candidatus Deferrimicrobiaceae bacterium]